MKSAFAPANLSTIFVICENKDPRKKGSLGIGCSLKQGVISKVSFSNKNIIYFNNKKINFPTVLSVIKKLTDKKIKVNLKSKLPLGAGFGLSGASALATSYALSKLLRLKISKRELAMVAHVAEVVNHTGLGDVGGQYNAKGFMMKIDHRNVLSVIDLKIKNIPLYYKYFSSISTKKIIGDNKYKNKINKAGIKALNKIKKLKKPSLERIIEISKEFAVNSNLLKNKRVIKTIKDIEKNNCKASMIMLGNAVFSNKPFKGSKKAIVK